MTIMVIDDDPSTLGVMKAMLRTMGHTVRAFTDAREAVRCVPDHLPDLVISDVNMPGMDGYEVARRVTECLGDSPPRVLLVSGSAAEETRWPVFHPAPVLGVLPKPFERETLSCVLSLLEKSRSCCPGILAPLCLYAPEGKPCTDHAHHPLCETTEYARCPHFSEHCGKMLRLWIATQDSLRTVQAPV